MTGEITEKNSWNIALRRINKTLSLNSIRRNPWIISTIFIALLLIIAIFFRSENSAQEISQSAAVDKLLSFIKAQGENVEIVSAEQEGVFYKIILKYQGSNVLIYVTNDGKYIVQNPIPLPERIADNGQSNITESEQEAINISKSSRPVVELFVMSLCPYDLQMEKGILPVVELLGGKIDFEVKFVYYAMHGKDEINENTRQYCIQKEQSSKFVAYMNCYVKDGDTDSCLTSAGIDKNKLNSCVDSTDKQFNISSNFDDESTWLNGRFPKYEVNAADNAKYNVAGSPALIINRQNVSSARDPASLLKLICSAFTTAPAECEQTLSSATSNPGFTAGSASGSANIANCIS